MFCPYKKVPKNKKKPIDDGHSFHAGLYGAWKISPWCQKALKPIAPMRFASTVHARRLDLAERFKDGETSGASWYNPSSDNPLSIVAISRSMRPTRKIHWATYWERMGSLRRAGRTWSLIAGWRSPRM